MLLGIFGPMEPQQLAPVEVFGGLRAMTVQDYMSLNCKTGTQWEASTYVPDFGAGAVLSSVVVVGALPMLIKARTVELDGAGVLLEVFQNPVYSGGVPVPVWNLNSSNPAVRTSTILGGVTVTDPGTMIAAPRRVLGSTGQGNSTLSSLGGDLAGIERVFSPNTTYLIRSTSMNTTGTMRYSSYTTWYEGVLDVQS